MSKRFRLPRTKKQEAATRKKVRRDLKKVWNILYEMREFTPASVYLDADQQALVNATLIMFRGHMAWAKKVRTGWV
jgi:hypothetical protein